MYIIWIKKYHCEGYTNRLDFIYYNNIILYISDNTHILHIPLMNTTHTTLKNRCYRINLNRRMLKYRLHTSPFEPVVQSSIVYRKKPKNNIKDRSVSRRLETTFVIENAPKE
jgi:hypothetical protein